MRLFTLLALLSLCCGCSKTHTNTQLCFEEIQQRIQTQTGYTPCWETCSEETTFNAYIENALSKKLTGDLAVYIALLNNQSLQAIYQNLGIAKAHLVQAGLLTNPLLTFSYRFSTNTSVTDLIDIGLIQNFLEILLIPLKKRVAASELEATKALVTSQILETIAQTKNAFYAYQALESIWDLKQQILLGIDSSFDAARRLYDAGNIKELELVEYRTRLAQKKAEIAQLEVEILLAKEKLNVLMGLWGTQIRWSAVKNLPPIQEKVCLWEQLETSAIENSLDLEISRKELYATAAGYGIDTSRIIFPQVDIGPSTERDEGVWFVGPAIALGIPLFDFGQAVSAAARAEILGRWNAYTALAIQIRSAARSKRVTLLNAHRQTLYYQKMLVPLSEQLTTLTLLQHNAMQLGVFHLLEAKINELEQKILTVE